MPTSPKMQQKYTVLTTLLYKNNIHPTSLYVYFLQHQQCTTPVLEGSNPASRFHSLSY
jgi:hypothetical protein